MQTPGIKECGVHQRILNNKNTKYKIKWIFISSEESEPSSPLTINSQASTSGN